MRSPDEITRVMAGAAAWELRNCPCSVCFPDPLVLAVWKQAHIGLQGYLDLTLLRLSDLGSSCRALDSSLDGRGTACFESEFAQWPL